MVGGWVHDLGGGLELIGEALVVGSLEAVVLQEVAERRYAEGVAQQALGRHHHQRLAEAALDLAPQHVEVVGRRRAVDDLPVGVLDLRGENQRGRARVSRVSRSAPRSGGGLSTKEEGGGGEFQGVGMVSTKERGQPSANQPFSRPRRGQQAHGRKNAPPPFLWHVRPEGVGWGRCASPYERTQHSTTTSAAWASSLGFCGGALGAKTPERVGGRAAQDAGGSLGSL